MKRKDLLIIIIPAFVVVVIWIGLNIYHNYITSTIPQSMNAQISPITPSFDTKTIQKIAGRQSVSPVYELGPVTATPSSTQIPTPTPTITTLVATNSAIPQASGGGNLTQ